METIYIVTRGKEAVLIHGNYYMNFKAESGETALKLARFESKFRSKEVRRKDKSAVVQLIEL